MWIHESFLVFFLLHTTVSTTLIISGSSSYAVEYHDFILSCESSVVLYDTFWTRNHQRLGYMHLHLNPCTMDSWSGLSFNYAYNCTNNRTFNLIIPNQRILQEDGSNWQCYEKGVSSQSEIYTFTVAKLPTSNPTVSGYNGIVLYPGNTITLTCTVQGGTPLATLSWICGGSSITGIVKSSTTVSISDVTLNINSSYNDQKCVCKAEHFLWTTGKTAESQRFFVYYIPSSDPIISGYDDSKRHENDIVMLTCKVSGGYPLATLSWSCDGKLYNGINKSADNTAINTLSIRMTSNLNRKTCICKGRHQAPGYNKDVQSVPFVVYFAPTVSLLFSTPLVERRQIDITCVAKGNPDKYFYSGWTQIYSGIVIRRGLNFGLLNADNSRLTLTDLSYQDIGVYTCIAHNSIKDRNGVLEQHGSAYLDVKFSPIFMDKSQNKFYAEPCRQLGIEILFFSNPFLDKSSITIIKTDRNNTHLGRNRYSLTMEPTELSLKFHGQNVNVNAQRAVIVIHSFQKDDTGNYNVIFKTTDRLTSNFRIDLLLSQPPEEPKSFAMVNKTKTTITVTWISGSNGGYSQTFVILYIPVNSKDRPIQVKMNEKEHQQNYHYTLKNLDPGTEYIIWIYSVNQKGNSYVLNNSFIPLKSKTEPLQNDKFKTENIKVIIGVVSAFICGIICAVTVLFVIKSWRNCNDKKTSKEGNATRTDADYADLNEEVNTNINTDGRNQSEGPSNVRDNSLHNDYQTLRGYPDSLNYRMIQSRDLNSIPMECIYVNTSLSRD